MSEQIREGFEVFLSDGAIAFGAVRHAPRSGAQDFVIYVENAGEFRVPLGAVRAIHDGKIVLTRSKLGAELQRAIGHAHEGEHEDE